MYKFFVNSNQINNNQIEILNEDVNHIKNVLRLNKNDEIQICNLNTSENYECKIIDLNSNSIKCEILSKLDETTESNVYIHILQGLPKSEKMETIIQKNTEIGVSEFTPVIMERCVVKLDNKNENKKIERWRKIAEVAAKQSKRDKIPIINNCTSLKNIYENLKDYDIVIVAYEEEKQQTLKQIIKEVNNKEKYRIAIIIGPEGGIAPKEIEFLKDNNSKIITLGKRILRTETAGMVISSIIMYELDKN